MKELSIEEKSKAYDEAIERAKEKYAMFKGMRQGDVLEDVFPELKESEDERIRKALVELVHDTTGDSLWVDYDVHKEDAIAWLEKQSGHANFLSKIQVGDKVTRNEDGVLVNLSQLNRVAKKQGEQKPVDKAEPKFKAGDWVVLSTSDGEKVVQIDSIEYFKCGEPRYITSEGRWFSNGTTAHIWTMQDAKDGDVLCDYHEAYDNPLIFILKKFEHVNFGLVRPSDYSSYCFLTAGDRQMFKEGTYHHKHNIKPATKEQCDLLFQKMKEAGYEWDSGKLELRRIEQNPAWSEEDEAIYYGVIETEQYMLDVVNGIKKFAVGNISIKEECTIELNWLKSLRDRVQLKQEWSEEDKKLWVHDDDIFLDAAKMIVEESPRKSYGGVHKKEIVPWFYSLKERLKSLRPQNTWKPSDEQMDALNDVISSRDIKYDVLSELWKDLEKLKGLSYESKRSTREDMGT